MTVTTIGEVEFGAEVPAFEPDTSLTNVRKFVVAAGWNWPRFTDHDAARKEGLPGALVPGILSQGYLAAMIDRWAPGGTIETIDTVFRAPVVADQPCRIRGVVTDVDEDEGCVEIDLTLTNERGETRIFGTATLRLPN